jgi:hypothetical protein
MSAAALTYRLEERFCTGAASMDKNERVALYKTLVGIPCIKDGNGVDASYVKDRLRALRTTSARTTAKRIYYGSREIRSILLLHEGGRRRSGREVVVAFAVVCKPTRFHRLRPKHVLATVHLALLCGTSAWRLVRALKAEYVDDGVGVTMDALPHVIAYYMNPTFGVVRMIDTEDSFRKSATMQREYTLDAAQPRRVQSMLAEIERGDEFTPAGESAFQRTRFTRLLASRGAPRDGAARLDVRGALRPVGRSPRQAPRIVAKRLALFTARAGAGPTPTRCPRRARRRARRRRRPRTIQTREGARRARRHRGA